LLHQRSDGRLVLAVNLVYAIGDLSVNDLVEGGIRWGVADAEAIVRTLLASLVAAVAVEVPLPGADLRMRSMIEANVERLITGR
jgi:hypothetical protein